MLIETELKDAAWYYPEPKEKANNIKDYVAFCMLILYRPGGGKLTLGNSDTTIVDVTAKEG